MPAQLLTDERVAALSCPQHRQHCEVYDLELRGLYVDIQRNERRTWRVRYYLDGKKHSHTLGDARVLTVTQARTAARDILRLALAGANPRHGDWMINGPTIRDFFCEQYLPYVRSYKRSWDTDESMIRNQVLPALGHLAMGMVKAPDIARAMERMKTAGYSACTINRFLVIVRYGYRLALRWQVAGVEKNPMQKIKNLKLDNKIERFLSQEEMRRLIEAVNNSANEILAPLVSFLLLTGARKREALDAKWEQIDWLRHEWRIPKTKSGKIRHVPLSTAAMNLLHRVQEKCVSASPYIFANPKTGLPYVSVFFSWHIARCQAGLPTLRVHDLRHSFASFLVNAGRTLYEVQELLGHADIRTTSRYAHLSRERLREAVETVPLHTC